MAITGISVPAPKFQGKMSADEFQRVKRYLTHNAFDAEKVEPCIYQMVDPEISFSVTESSLPVWRNIMRRFRKTQLGVHIEEASRNSARTTPYHLVLWKLPTFERAQEVFSEWQEKAKHSMAAGGKGLVLPPIKFSKTEVLTLGRVNRHLYLGDWVARYF